MKYRVQVSETTIYEIEVEAKDKRDARHNALDVIACRTSIDQHMLSLDDRRVILVEPIK